MTGERKLSPAAGLLLIAAGVFVLVSLLSYHPDDAANAAAPTAVMNYSGLVGAWISLYLLLLVGYASYGIAVLLVGEGISRLVPRHTPPRSAWIKVFYEFLMIVSLAPLLSLFPLRLPGIQLESFGGGGFWGDQVSRFLGGYLGVFGTRLVLVTVFLVSAALLTEMKPLIYTATAVRRLAKLIAAAWRKRRRSEALPARPGIISARDTKEREQAEKEKKRKEKAARKKKKEEEKEEKRRALKRKKPKIVTAAQPARPSRAEEKSKPDKPRKKKFTRAPALPSGGKYRLPSIDLLESPPPLSQRQIKDDIEENSRILEGTLMDFGIESQVVGVKQGPAITRYELEIAAGVKVGKIKALDNDIALTMKATSVRILAPIPGKAAIGIEVPNSKTNLVYMKEMIESPEFKKNQAHLPLALGKDISGRAIVSDLTQMPHLLIAGATGSGKTVCMNTIIMSLLYSKTPDEMKIVMVDPKKVEMAAFRRLPHLICPIITDAGKTALALDWLMGEMEDRYDLCAEVGVRNIEGYNRASKKNKEGENIDLPEKMPYIVLMIDELADLMLVAAKEIEGGIARLAHLSRAVGIHMILATQRPSVDVITGVIKANLPGRISFKVAAKVDSRTVLDSQGADKLLGQGDLLFLPPGTHKLIRAQGTLCHDQEIKAVVDFVTQQREPEFNREIFQKKIPSAGAPGGTPGDGDIFLESAIDVIKQTDQASVSMLQRKLKIGYSRAARIMDQLEEMGVVGPYQGTKARDILIGTYAGDGTKEEEE